MERTGTLPSPFPGVLFPFWFTPNITPSFQSSCHDFSSTPRTRRHAIITIFSRWTRCWKYTDTAEEEKKNHHTGVALEHQIFGWTRTRFDNQRNLKCRRMSYSCVRRAVKNVSEKDIFETPDMGIVKKGRKPKTSEFMAQLVKDHLTQNRTATLSSAKQHN